MPKKEIVLSIIICTRNRDRLLGSTLDSMSRCTIPRGLGWEIIVVDNNSSDHTSQMVDSYRGKLPLHYLFEPEGGLSQARNRGIASASGNLIIFSDDDIKPVSNWIKLYWDNFRQKTGNFMFGGPIVSMYEAEEIDYALMTLAPPSIAGLDFGSEPKILASNEYFVSSNWACPARGIRKAGGFDHRLGLNESNPGIVVGEEIDLMVRLENMGYRKWYIPEAKVIHHVPSYKSTLGHIASRKKSSGYSDVIKKDFTGYSTRRFIGFIAYHSVKGLNSVMKYCIGIAMGRKDYYAYLEWKRFLGIIKGLRQRKRNAL